MITIKNFFLNLYTSLHFPNITTTHFPIAVFFSITQLHNYTSESLVQNLITASAIAFGSFRFPSIPILRINKIISS